MNPEEYAQLFRLGETHWWFTGTRDILFSSVSSSQLDGKNILDAGCGSGLMMKRFSGAGKIYGVDKSFEALSHCCGLGFRQVCQGDTLHLPFKSSTFDLIVAADLLEHCDDDEQALDEFYRVNAAGGRLLVSVPAYNALWSSHDVSLHHKRRYTKNELTRKALRCGYDIERATYFNTVLFPAVALVRLTAGKWSKNHRIQYHENLRLLNELLLGILNMERRLLQKLNFPFGLSLLLLGSKK
jgi:ubiquinone/menaquinone biosynthesis C-methylase UbiE